MLPTSRKRPVDPAWRDANAPKAPRLLHGDQPAPIAVQPPRVNHGPLNPPLAQNFHHSVQAQKHIIFIPAVRHGPHPDSKLCQDFHWVPYPLGLMGYDSWHKLHNRDGTYPLLPFRCPLCRVARKVNAHMRKLFLVGERLAWEDGMVSDQERDQNEQLTWEVNYELGIVDPFVRDPEPQPGGKKSQINKWYPYQNEYEMKQALNLISITKNITEASWSLWIGLQMNLQKMMGDEERQPVSSKCEQGVTLDLGRPIGIVPSNGMRKRIPSMIDLTVSPDRATSKKTSYVSPHSIPTSSSFFNGHSEGVTLPLQESTTLPESTSSAKAQSKMALPEPQKPAPYFNNHRRIKSYKTLPDFYSLLDQIEPTSYVGALFLEAYAEHLKGDVCKDCWLEQNIEPDLN